VCAWYQCNAYIYLRKQEDLERIQGIGSKTYKLKLETIHACAGPHRVSLQTNKAICAFGTGPTMALAIAALDAKISHLLDAARRNQSHAATVSNVRARQGKQSELSVSSKLAAELDHTRHQEIIG
jgi:hypothetical protein